MKNLGDAHVTGRVFARHGTGQRTLQDGIARQGTGARTSQDGAALHVTGREQCTSGDGNRPTIGLHVTGRDHQHVSGRERFARQGTGARPEWATAAPDGRTARQGTGTHARPPVGACAPGDPGRACPPLRLRRLQRAPRPHACRQPALCRYPPGSAVETPQPAGPSLLWPRLRSRAQRSWHTLCVLFQCRSGLCGTGDFFICNLSRILAHH